MKSHFESVDADVIESTTPLSFGCIIDRDVDIIFGKLPEEQKKDLREIVDISYTKFLPSPVVSELVKVLLEKSKSLNKREMMISLSPIQVDFQGNDEEFEDLCVMHKILDSM